jgi:hypothetical protein
LLNWLVEGILFVSETCSFIVNDRWNKDRLNDASEESEHIVTVAAKLISAQIRERMVDVELYPTKSEMSSDDKKCTPPLLQKFLQFVVPNQLKQVSLGQSIVQAARLHSFLSPLLLGLALKLDVQYGS